MNPIFTAAVAATKALKVCSASSKSRHESLFTHVHSVFLSFQKIQEMDDELGGTYAQDNVSSKSAFASVPTALLARKTSFSAEDKATKEELAWLSKCSELMRQDTVWSCAGSDAQEVWRFALVLVGSVCQRLREQWASIAQWASDEEKSVFATFLDASALFALRACATADVFQDGFRLLSVLCCDEHKSFESDASVTLPAPLRDPQNPVNAFMAVPPLARNSGASAPLTDSIEQVLAKSMGPCTQSPLSVSVPDAASTRSFVSRCLETVAKHRIVEQLLEQAAARSGSNFLTAALSFLASAKACLTPAHIPLLVNLVSVLVKQAQQHLCDALSRGTVGPNNDSAEQERALAGLKSALQVLSLAEGDVAQSNYKRQSAFAGWSILSAASSPLPPLEQEGAPSSSSVPLSTTVLQFVDAALVMLDHVSVQPLFTGEGSDTHALYKFVQNLVFCSRKMRATPSSPCFATATPAVTPYLRAPPAPPPPPMPHPELARNSRLRYLCLRRRLEEADGESSNRNDDDSLCGTMFDETPLSTSRTAPNDGGAQTPLVRTEYPEMFSDRVLCHALELLSRELVRAPLCLKDPELVHFLAVLSKLLQGETEPASLRNAWCTLLQQLSACSHFPANALMAFVAQNPCSPDRTAFFARWWLSQVVRLRRNSSPDLSALLDSVGKSLWTQSLQSLVSGVASTSDSDAAATLPSFAQSVFLLLVWRTGLAPETQSVLLNALLGCIGSRNTTQSLGACLATTRATFFAQAVMCPSVVTDQDILALVQQTILDPNPPELSSLVLPDHMSCVSFTTTTGAGPFVYFAWKLFTVPPCVADLPLSSEEAASEWYQAVLESFSRASSLHIGFSAVYNQSLWSFLWCLRPPASFYEQLKDPAFLLTFGVNDATTYLLSWLVFVSFSSSSSNGATLPIGCPKRSEIPLSAHIEACLVLLSSLACKSPEQDDHTYTNDSLALAVLLFLYSCLPSSAITKARSMANDMEGRPAYIPLSVLFKQIIQEPSGESVMTDTIEQHQSTVFPFCEIMHSVSVHGFSDDKEDDEVVAFIRANMTSIVSSVAFLVSFLVSRCNDMLLADIMQSTKALPASISPVVAEAVRQSIAEFVKPLFSALGLSSSLLSVLPKWNEPCLTNLLPQDSSIQRNPASMFLGELTLGFSSTSQPAASLRLVTMCALQLLRCVCFVVPPSDIPKDAVQAMIPAISADGLGFTAGDSMVDTLSIIFGASKRLGIVGPFILDRLSHFLSSMSPLFASSPSPGIVGALYSCVDLVLGVVESSIASPLCPALQEFYFGQDSPAHVVLPVVTLLLSCRNSAIITRTLQLLCSAVDPQRPDKLGQSFARQIALALMSSDRDALLSFISATMVPAGPLESSDKISCSVAVLLSAVTQAQPVFGQQLCAGTLFSDIVPLAVERSANNACGYIPFVALIEQIVVRHHELVKLFLQVIQELCESSPVTSFSVNLLVVLQRMLVACSGTAAALPQGSSVPTFTECSCDSLVDKYIALIQKVAPWWQWGPQGEPLAADNVPLDALCTFVRSKKEYLVQHWYHCYTCGLTDHTGVCSVCAATCHRNHETVYHGYTEFYCDCGANDSKKKCHCVKARTLAQASSLAQKDLPKPGPQSPSSKSDRHEKSNGSWLSRGPYASLSEDELSKLSLTLLSDTSVLQTLVDALGSFASNKQQRVPSARSGIINVFLEAEKHPSALKYVKAQGSHPFIASTKQVSFDSRSSRFRDSVGSFLSNEQRDDRRVCGILGNNVVVAMQKGVSLFQMDSSQQKSSSSSSKTAVALGTSFNVVGMCVRKGSGSMFVVYGLHECVVCVLENGPECKIAARINLTPSCTHPIRAAYWLPESTESTHPCLFIETESCVQVFDLLASLNDPIYHFVLPPAELSSGEKIFRSRAVSMELPPAESAMADVPSDGNQICTVLFVCLTNGQIFAAPLDSPASEPGEVPLSHELLIPSLPGSSRFAPPLSVFDCVSLDAGNRVCIRVCSESSHTVKYDVVVNSSSDSDREFMAERAFCTDEPAKRGRLVTYNTRYLQTPEALFLFGISANKKRICVLVMTSTGEKLLFCLKPSSRPLAGIDVVSQSPFDRATVVAVTSGEGAVLCVTVDLSAVIDVLKASKPSLESEVHPRFSKRFFEHCKEVADLWIITSPDIKDCAGAKTNLLSGGKYVASPYSSKGFAFTVHVTDESYCIVGVIAGFGFASKGNVPRFVTISRRRFVLKPRSDRFYEFPLTIGQVMRSPSELTIELSECPNDTKPVIDSLRVFVAKKSDLLPAGVKWPQPELFSSTRAVYQRVIPQQFVSSALHAITSLYSCSDESRSTFSSNAPAVLDSLTRLLVVSPCARDSDVVQDVLATFVAMTRSPEESRWLVDRALLTRVIRARNSTSEQLLSSLGVLSAVCSQNASHVLRFVEAENADPFQALASALAENNKLTEAQTRSACTLLSDSMVALLKPFVEPVDEGSSAQEPHRKIVFGTVCNALRTLLLRSRPTVQSVVVDSFAPLLQKLSPSTRTDADKEDMEDTLRTGLFSCDVCGESPIQGKHWRCQACDDFDLCDKCHRTVTSFPHGHLSTHPMVVHDDGRVISCTVCGKSMLATRWMTCPRCEAVVCHVCSKNTHTHCSDAELVPATPQTKPLKSFLSSLFQTAVVDDLDNSASAGTAKCLEDSKRPFKYECGCACSRESPDLDEPEQMSLDESDTMDKQNECFTPYILFMTTLASELLSTVRETLKTRSPESEQTLVAVLQSVHAVCICMFDLVHDPSVISRALDVLRVIVSEMSDALESTVDSKEVTLVLLFVGSLFDTLKNKCAALPHCSGSLSDLISSIVTSSFLNQIRKALHRCIPATCETNTQAPMSEDKPDSENDSHRKSAKTLLALLDPSASASASATISYSPLVPDEYCSQGQDIFADVTGTVVLALVRLARVALQIVKPGDMDPEWKSLAGGLIGASLSRYVRKEAKQLAVIVCGDEVTYHMLCDERKLDAETKWLAEKAESSEHFTAPLTSPECAQIATHIGVLVKVASKRGNVWRAYCSAHPTVYPILYSSIVSVASLPSCSPSREFIAPFLSLLNASLSGKVDVEEEEKEEEREEEKEEEKKEKEEPKKRGSKARRVEKRIILPDEEVCEPPMVEERECSPEERKFMASVIADVSNLLVFVDALSLQHSDADVRRRASRFLLMLWYKAASAQELSVLSDVFTHMLHSAPSVGSHCAPFMNALRDATLLALSESGRGECAQKPAAVSMSLPVDAKAFVSVLRAQNRVFVTHPNASLYRNLRGEVEHGSEFVLEPHPCLVCNPETTEFKSEELKSIVAQTRATSTALFHRLDTTYVIKSLRVVLEKRRSTSRTVKVLNIYTSTRRVADVIDLRNKWDLWKRVQSLRLAPGEKQREITFTPPVPAANLCVEVAEVHEPDTKDALVCPRCSNRVPDRHGVCSHCGENAYQCRSCRYIPYENFNAFFCPQCGACRESQLDVTVSVCKSFVPEPVESDDDLKKATECLKQRAKEASTAFKDLTKLRYEAIAAMYMH